jgi:hypothetical protein
MCHIVTCTFAWPNLAGKKKHDTVQIPSNRCTGSCQEENKFQRNRSVTTAIQRIKEEVKYHCSDAHLQGSKHLASYEHLRLRQVAVDSGQAAETALQMEWILCWTLLLMEKGPCMVSPNGNKNPGHARNIQINVPSSFCRIMLLLLLWDVSPLGPSM